MKASILTFCFIIFHAIGFAQDASQAKAILDDVSSKAKTYKNISIDFKYKVDSALGSTSQETRGDVVISGDNYVLNILGVTRIFDGETLYTINPEDEEVTISSNNSDVETTISPDALLTFYQVGYAYSMDIVQNVNGRKIQYVKLTPSTAASGVQYVLLGIDTKTNNIYNMIEVAQDGTKTTLTVNSFKTNEPLSETLFTFDESKYSTYFINRID